VKSPRGTAVLSLLLAGSFFVCGTALAGRPVHSLAALFAERLDSAPDPDLQLARDASADRGFAPGWTDGRVAGPAVHALLDLLAGAADEGLDPRDYGLQALRAALARAERAAPRSRAWLELDLELTRAAAAYGNDLAHGRLSPDAAAVRWLLRAREADVAGAIVRALETGRIAESLGALAPPHPEYARLRFELGRLRAAERAGGWPGIPEARPTAASAAAPDLRRALAARLAAEDYLPTGVSSPQLLSSALKAFQELHGLSADGVLGPATRRALAEPAARRARRVQLNMERWRWVPDELGDVHVRVNLPAYSLTLHEGGREVLRSRVIVGRKDWATPAFTDALQQVMVNPYWNVPDVIARRELLPKLKRDPALLQRRRYTVLDGWRTDARVVDPRTINWRSLSAANFPYRLRQEPGGGNALGRLIFMLDNDFEIYLHDTPGKRLFDRSERALSHGCIRVDASRALADRLFASEGRGPELRQGLASGRNGIVQLQEAVPLHVVHFTATPGEGGRIRSLPDLYGVDAALDSALSERERRALPVR
jgi:murein L,D-transpeptidase YcbB/YkuD